METETIAAAAKALGHPARLQIVELLSRQTECSGSEVFAELDLAQSTVSEHLRILREAGIVNSSRVGTSVVYCLDACALEKVASTLQSLADTACRYAKGPC
jgi:ArsR family transcriptional regulator, arsenate/arsenite/antimonite-responsive transcriptional repressor